MTVGLPLRKWISDRIVSHLITKLRRDAVSSKEFRYLSAENLDHFKIERRPAARRPWNRIEVSVLPTNRTLGGCEHSRCGESGLGLSEVNDGGELEGVALEAGAVREFVEVFEADVQVLVWEGEL